MGRGSGRGNVRRLFQNPQLTCLAELTSQLGSQTGSRGLNGAWQWAFACCFRTRNFLAAVLEAAVDAPTRPVGAAVSVPAAYGVYPLIILIVYVIVRLLFQQPQFTHPPDPSTPAVSEPAA